jgi:outer membrane protein OmpA-like peptidoglycan-associated protein
MQTRNRYSLTLYAVAIIAIMSFAPASLPVSWNSGTAFADDVSTEVIIRSLKRHKTRGLTLSKSPNDEVIEELIKKKRKTRGLNLQERDELFELSSEKQQIDLPVYFELSSWEISPRARRTLNKLGNALSDIELEGDTFLVGGHTDRRGSSHYNQTLSERRAKAVRAYLLQEFDIEPDALVAVGFGFEKLKNPDNPMAAENRRVQLVNVTP